MAFQLSHYVTGLGSGQPDISRSEVIGGYWGIKGHYYIIARDTAHLTTGHKEVAKNR